MADQWGLIPLPLGQQFEPAASEQANQPADIFGGLIGGWTTSAASITGSLGATEAGTDTYSSSGTVTVQGSLNTSEVGNDTFSSSGNVVVQGSLGSSETGIDAFSSTGSVVVQGSLSVTEAQSDTFAATGSVSTNTVTGSLSVSEVGNDSFQATGLVLIYGNLAANEAGDDQFSANGNVVVSGSLSITEDSDFLGTAEARFWSGLVLVQGGLSAISENDVFESTGFEQPIATGITGGGIRRSKILEAAKWILDLLDKDTVKQTEQIKKVKAKLKKVTKPEDLQDLQPIVNAAIVEVQKQKKISEDLVRLNFIINELKIIKNQLDDEEEALLMLMA